MKRLLLALTIFAATMPGRARADQPTSDLDFGALLFGPPSGGDQLTTFAVDSVGGNDANAGTLSAPKLTLQHTTVNGEVVGLYRGSFFRDSLSYTSLGATHGIVVQGVTPGAAKALPIISALDAMTGSYDVTDDVAFFQWAPTDPDISNDGYANVYVVEIDIAAEAKTPIAARRRMIDVSSDAACHATPGSVWILPPGTGSGQSGSTSLWGAEFHPTGGISPVDGVYRYEVVSRVQPINFGGSAVNQGDGAVSGLELIGGSSGYGSLTGPPSFAGDRLVFVHGTTHHAVLGGGSLQRSIFYEGDLTAQGSGIQLAWYSDSGAGKRWSMNACLFYANVGDRPAYCLISHTNGGSNFDRGDISSCAFLGARWANSTLQGTAIDYVNVAAGLIDSIYVFGIRNVFGPNMPATMEIRKSVFQSVNATPVAGSFHDNIVESEGATNLTDPQYQAPCSFLFAQNGASVVNNLCWAHGLPAAATDGGASGFNFGTGVTTGTSLRNIIVLNPASPAAETSYTQVFPGSLSGVALDYNLVICTGQFRAPHSNGDVYTSWAAYRAAYPTLDVHSMFVDLSTDSRGLGAVFVDPLNGDFRWAQTAIAQQCSAYCAANNVGPVAVTSHWPVVPTVDAAVAAITLLPPRITSPGAVTFTQGASSAYHITTDLDGTADAPSSYGVLGQPTWLSVNASSGTLSGTPPQAGGSSLSISATNQAGPGSEAFSITVQTPFVAWQTASFTAAELRDPTVSGPGATPAGDGIPNLMKYSLGLNPKSNGTAGLPTGASTTIGASNYLTLTYQRPLNTTDVTYTVEVSGDLQSWSSGANATATVSTTINAAGTMQTVVQRDLVPIGSTKRRFVRLKVTQP